MSHNVFDCILLELPRIQSSRSGNITTLENNKEIPFSVNRIFYLYDIPGGESRGAHSHRQCQQFLIAASGSFEVQLDDGFVKKTVMLNQPFRGLFIPPGIWASEVNFSSGAICLVLASHKYDENDYIREYDEFLSFIKNKTDK